jgi:hypothetical protein
MSHTSQNLKQHSEGKLGQAAFHAFLAIAVKWKLNIDQQRILLGNIPKSTYHLWKRNVEKMHEIKLPKDTLERISYILGIYKALHILLSTNDAANCWIYRNNTAPLFGNKPALTKMLAGNVVDLADVRRYLDAERGS